SLKFNPLSFSIPLKLVCAMRRAQVASWNLETCGWQTYDCVNSHINRIFSNCTGMATSQSTKEVPHMPTTKELTIRTEDRPGTLAKVCKALAERKVNILAFQSVPTEGNSMVRFVVDNPGTAKKVLENQGLSYTETEIAQVELPHRPGELAQAASRLGEANININYAYGGVDPSTNAPLIIFGVTDAGQVA